MAAMVANSWFNFYGVRDLVIISGYLLLFVFSFRAPTSLVDVGLATLTVCLIIEASSRLGPPVDILGTEGIYGFLGLSTSFGTGLFGSHGILESTLGFPLGAVFLYYMHGRKWRHALVAAIFMFMAFKRISFIGVAVALGFDTVIGRSGRSGQAGSWQPLWSWDCRSLPSSARRSSKRSPGLSSSRIQRRQYLGGPI